MRNIGNTCYLATATQCLLALNAVRFALRCCKPRLDAAVAAAAPAAGAEHDHTAADGSVTSALAGACEHVWGGGYGVFVPTRLWACVVEKSINRELAPRHPHDASLALQLILEHLVADVQQVRANDQAWLTKWLPHMSAHFYETTVCRGRACTAADVRPTCRRLAGTLPLVDVHVPRDDGTPTDLATLLAKLAAPERRGDDPICNGVSCERGAATGVRCPCPAQLCAGKTAAHALQPCETRKGIWPPPREECNIAMMGKNTMPPEFRIHAFLVSHIR